MMIDEKSFFDFSASLDKNVRQHFVTISTLTNAIMFKREIDPSLPFDMRRSSQNDDNRFYAFLPPNGSTSSRTPMIPSPNRNAHYQFYDPRLRSQHQLQQNLFEYQYSSTNPQRSLPSLYGSPRHQYHYPSSSSLINELSTISTNNISDLGEPISVFDEIQPLEHRRSTAIVPAAPLPSRYIPPDATRRPSATDVRLVTANVLREQLLTDIERTFDDIDRELTSLERRPSVPRYLPPRFSPIAEFDTQQHQQVKPARQGTTTIKRPSVSSRRTIPTLPSPAVRQSVPQSTTNSATQERNSGTSQLWPNKPKRVYEVIPRLTSDSKRTSRQSSFTAQPEQIKMSEVSTPETPIKSSIKPITSASIQFNGQYHYPPEAEEVEILKNDPENTEYKAQIQEFERAPPHKTLNPSQFLRELSARAENRAIIFVPEYSGASRIQFQDEPEYLLHAESVPPTLPRPYSSESKDIEEPMKELTINDHEFTVPSAAAKWVEPEIKSRSTSARSERIQSAAYATGRSPKREASPDIHPTHPARIGSEYKPRIPSRSTITPPALYHKTEDFFTEPDNTIIAKSTKHVRSATRTSDATPVPESPRPQTGPRSASTARKSPIDDPKSSLPASRQQSANVDDTAGGDTAGEENEHGMVAYFFSEYGNEGDEDMMSIDHSNFNVPVSNYVGTDDERSTNMISPSQGSILILQSAKIGRVSELGPTKMRLKSATNDQSEEKEFQREESDVTQKPRFPLPTSSPSNRPFSPSSPSPTLPIPPEAAAAAEKTTITQQRLPISIDDDVGDDDDENMRKPFDKNNSLSNDDEQQATHMWKDDENIFKSQEEQQHEIRRSPRSATSSSRTHSRIQSAASDRENMNPLASVPQTPIHHRPHHANADDDHDDQISPREQSPRPPSKLSSRQLSRTTATLSPEKKFDDDAISRESPKTLTRDPSPKRTPFPPLTPPLIVPQPVVLANTGSYLQQSRRAPAVEKPAPSSPDATSITAQSFNLYLGSPTSLTREAAGRAVIKENEPHAFSAESEHFLRGKPETSYDMNQRAPSSHLNSLSNQSSRQSSTLHSPLPVTLESPDGSNEPPKTSRTATPHKKTSVATVEVPANAHALFTTTDEADPENPSVVRSTLHFQLYPSQMQTYSPAPMMQNHDDDNDDDDGETNPLTQAVPSTMNEDPLVQDENTQRSPSPSQLDHRLRSASSHRSVSPSKSEHQLPLSTPTPTLSYPARLEDLMRPTPSPLRPNHDQPSDDELNDPNPSASSPPSALVEPDPVPLVPSAPPVQHTFSSKFTPTAQLESPPPSSPQLRTHQSHRDSPHVKRTHVSGHKEPTFITEPQRGGSSERSVSSSRSEHQNERLKREHGQLSSASLKKPALNTGHRPEESSISSSPPPPQYHHQPQQHKQHDRDESLSNDEELAYMTPSQQQSKLSLRVRRKEPKRKTTSFENLEMQNDTEEVYSTHDEDQSVRRPTKSRRRKRRVSFSNTISQFQMEERNLLTNWRERVASILASKHSPKEKYAHIPARVNSFANFEYQPRRIKTMPPRPMQKSNNSDENQFQKRKKYRVKKPRLRTEPLTDENTDEEGQEATPLAKETAPQLFGRLWCLPDGSPTVFHESLEWNAESRIKNYSYENVHHEPRRRDFKIFNKKTQWHSESKLADLSKEFPSTVNQRQYFSQSTPRTFLGQSSSLPSIPDSTDPYAHRPITRQRTAKARKIFDIQNNHQRQNNVEFKQNFMDNHSYHSYGSKPSDGPIFDEKLSWDGKSRVKNTTWENIDHKPKKSDVQIFHKSVHWNSEPKIRTRSPSIINPSRTSNNHVQIFDERLNWDAQAKVHCWSEIDLRQITSRRAILTPYHDPKWSDIASARVDATNYQHPRLNNQVEIFSDRLVWNQDSKLKDYVWENFDYKSQSRTRKSKDRKAAQGTTTDQESENLEFDLRLSSMFLPQFRRVNTPPNRPRWNAVSKKSSVNLLYNPKVTNSNTIRRGWDRELRRKRVHKLPPLKRKLDQEDLPQLELEGPSSQLTSSNQLALEYPYDHSSTTQGRTTSNGYMTTSSRRSSKALVPLNHHRGVSELAIPAETPRSQRPVQQEWYEEMSKSRLTHRTEGDRAATTRSFRHSIDSIHNPNTPKDLVTFRSSTRNSQNSVMSGTLLDSSIKSNRATELRLLKDMDEHHHHSHTPSQSMPIEIRGFKLEGTSISVPDHATIRPLSNVNYQGSERVKSRRVYPWSSLHPLGTTSRNSSLVPIAELRRPSLDTTINEGQTLINEE